jgi:hypothetical protein
MNIFEIDELYLDGWRWIMDQVHIWVNGGELN